MNSSLPVQCQVWQTASSIDDEEGCVGWCSDRRKFAARGEAVMLDSRAEVIAGRAHRLYVFGVIFSALVLVGFVLTAIFAGDSETPVDRPPSIDTPPSAN